MLTCIGFSGNILTYYTVYNKRLMKLDLFYKTLYNILKDLSLSYARWGVFLFYYAFLLCYNI